MAYTRATRDGLVPKTKPTKTIMKAQKELSKIPTFDLTRLNLLQLAQDLESTLSTPKPTFAIFKWWGNKKAKLDADHQEWVLTQIRNLRNINEQLVHLQAEVFLSMDMVTDLINGYRAEAERKVELAIKEHETKLYGLDKEMESQDLTNDKLRAEIEQVRTSTDESKTRIDLMRKVVDSIDLNELPDYLRAFVIASVFNPNQPLTEEMQLMGELKDIVIRSKDAQTRQIEAQASLAEHKKDETIRRDKKLRS